jgi:hypothetical protein
MYLAINAISGEATGEASLVPTVSEEAGKEESDWRSYRRDDLPFAGLDVDSTSATLHINPHPFLSTHSYSQVQDTP